MGSRERWERNQKAIEEGNKAYRDGLTVEDCPYKISEWGLGHWWLMGWNEAKQEAGEYHEEIN
ncbi:hypothetical protein LCGC14_2243610 [marine sediment metagenome]|uniref:Ribosome modulation factor n=1 Tax=marine sediment metagenome TaxID=412755 RepID=A0A0F9DSB2_9ZZZZ